MHWKVKTKSGTIFNPGLALIQDANQEIMGFLDITSSGTCSPTYTHQQKQCILSFLLTIKQNSKLTLKDRKTESIRKLSNFNSQWTKPLYQNILSHIIFFLHFSRAINVISYL